VGDYLSIRRAHGFKLERAGELLTQFVDYRRGHEVDVITVDIAPARATSPHGAAPR